MVTTANNKMPEIFAFINKENSTTQIRDIVSGLQKAADDLQFKIEIFEVDLTNQLDEAVKTIRKAISKSPKAFIVYSFENDVMLNYLKKANNKGISLIYMDSGKSYGIPGTYVTYKKKGSCSKSRPSAGRSNG